MLFSGSLFFDIWLFFSHRVFALFYLYSAHPSLSHMVRDTVTPATVQTTPCPEEPSSD